MSDELPELLWNLVATLALKPELERALDNVVAGPCFAAADLPARKTEARKVSGNSVATTGQHDLLREHDEDDASD